MGQFALQQLWILASRLALILLAAWFLGHLYDSKIANLFSAFFVTIYTDIIAIYRLTTPSLDTKDDK